MEAEVSDLGLEPNARSHPVLGDCPADQRAGLGTDLRRRSSNRGRGCPGCGCGRVAGCRGAREAALGPRASAGRAIQLLDLHCSARKQPVVLEVLQEGKDACGRCPDVSGCHDLWLRSWASPDRRPLGAPIE